TECSRRFVRKRIKQLGIPARYPAYQPARRDSVLSGPIAVKQCTLTVSAPLIRTKATRKIQQAFGVNREMLSATLFSNLSFAIRPVEFILSCGPSRAGKTSLLSILRKQLSEPSLRPDGLAGSIEVPRIVSF